MAIAVIPARGGSKRIPHKNVRPFAGAPMMSYPMRAVLRSGAVESVFVTTDDPEIAAVAEKYGAKAPFLRDAALSGDFVTSTEAVADAVRRLRALGEDVSEVLCIYATAPFAEPSDITGSYRLWRESGADYCISMCAYDFPWQRACRIGADGLAVPVDRRSIMMRSQDLEPRYHDAGAFYWASGDVWMSGKSPWETSAAAFLLPEERVLDIDTPEDFRKAELMYLAMHGSDPKPGTGQP